MFTLMFIIQDVMCCTAKSGLATPGEGARYWGEYTCDLPSWTAENLYQHIAETEPVSSRPPKPSLDLRLFQCKIDSGLFCKQTLSKTKICIKMIKLSMAHAQ